MGISIFKESIIFNHQVMRACSGGVIRSKMTFLRNHLSESRNLLLFLAKSISKIHIIALLSERYRTSCHGEKENRYEKYV